MTNKQALFKGKDYITTQEWADAEIETLLEVSGDLKRKFRSHVPHRHLLQAKQISLLPGTLGSCKETETLTRVVGTSPDRGIEPK